MEVDDIPSIFMLLSADLANLNINVDWCDEHFLDLGQYWEGRWNVARVHVIGSRVKKRCVVIATLIRTATAATDVVFQIHVEPQRITAST